MSQYPTTPFQPGVKGAQCHPECAALLAAYLAFIQDVRGVSEATLRVRTYYIGGFLAYGLKHQCAPEALRALQASTVHDYVIAQCLPLTRAVRRHLVTAVRSFLQYLHITGAVPAQFVEAVPTMRTYRLTDLPRAMAWDDVPKLLAAIDRRTIEGRRNFAMLTLIATYGCRMSQVTQLTMDGLDWAQGVVHFPIAKGGKGVSMPLTPDAADALLAYLADRGPQPYAHVFLTAKGDPRPMPKRANLGGSLARYYRLAGVTGPTKGVHTIRHAFATRLLAQGTPIKTIADMLGHRHLDSTFIYAKADVERLRTAAAAWPTEVR